MIFYIHALQTPTSHFIEKCNFSGSCPLSSGTYFIDHFLYRMAIQSPPGIWKGDVSDTFALSTCRRIMKEPAVPALLLCDSALLPAGCAKAKTKAKPAYGRAAMRQEHYSPSSGPGGCAAGRWASVRNGMLAQLCF